MTLHRLENQLKVIYWFYGLHRKHEFRRVLRVTKPHNIYEVAWQIQGAWKFESLKGSTNKVQIETEVLFTPTLDMFWSVYEMQ